jgi:enoyl-CoA hydratase
MMSSIDTLVKEVKDNVGTLTLSRPERRNALSPDMLVGIHLTLSAWATEGAVRAVVIRGAGDKAFSGGYDIRAIPTNPDPEMERVMRDANPLELGLRAVRDYPYPVIAMIRGACFGAALNLAMCCDLRIGADDVVIGMPPAKLGLVYPADGIAQFVAVLGAARAREVFFTAKTYRGADALAMGLVDRLYTPADLETAAYGLAEDIAGNAPLSLRGLKRIFNLLQDAAVLSPEAQAEADALVAASFSSADAVEGQMAFLEKRRPRFTGR